jgi:hypothetical protein
LLRNGELLEAVEADGFQVFVTGDQNLAYQQNLQSRRIAIVELTKNNWPSVEPHIARIVAAIDSAAPGTSCTIECGYVFRGRNPRAEF